MFSCYRNSYEFIKYFLALEHWCSITYYEFDTQVGETFKVRKDQIEVVFEVHLRLHLSLPITGRLSVGILVYIRRLLGCC